MTKAAYVKYLPLEGTTGRLACLILNRSEAANSFNGELLNSLTSELEALSKDKSIRLLMITGAGKHFSAGADLNWMKDSAKLDLAGNLAESGKLLAMFEALAHLPFPTMALVNGAAFGGGVGLVAACDYAVALTGAKLCLSEVRIGLIPAVILPYLKRKVDAGHLNRLALSGRVFSAEEAQNVGLVQAVISREALEPFLIEEINQILAASPEAQVRYKILLEEVDHRQGAQGQYTVEAIAAIRVSPAGQAGLHAFLTQKPQPWAQKISDVKPLLP